MRLAMAIEKILEDICNKLRQGAFANEQAISQGVVLRILQQLEWDGYDTTLVWPEYQTGGGRADFALCNPAFKPAIFIEVKQPGKAENAVKQALEYAFHTGVPFVVLTDGRTWSFYLPAEQGSYEDRRVYKLDLYERSPAEAAEIFIRYLHHSRVKNGEALEAARKEYRSRNRRAEAKRAIPEAWRELIERGDETLIEIITSAVEIKAGVRPDENDVADYLLQLGRNITPVLSVNSKPKETPPAAAVKINHSEPDPKSTRAGYLIIANKSYPYANAKEAMVIILTELANQDANFLERLSRHPDISGRKRKYIARTTEELYPDREDLRSSNHPLPGGWLVATNLNNILKKNIIKVAAEVAGLGYMHDIIIDL
jgi:predicted type IV restriction endonuclease